MDAAKLREEERISLVESELIARVDEITEITFYLLHADADSQSKARHDQRLAELRSEMTILWQQYARLVGTTVPDLQF